MLFVKGSSTSWRTNILMKLPTNLSKSLTLVDRSYLSKNWVKYLLQVFIKHTNKTISVIYKKN